MLSRKFDGEISVLLIKRTRTLSLLNCTSLAKFEIVFMNNMVSVAGRFLHCSVQVFISVFRTGVVGNFFVIYSSFRAVYIRDFALLWNSY